MPSSSTHKKWRGNQRRRLKATQKRLRSLFWEDAKENTKATAEERPPQYLFPTGAPLTAALQVDLHITTELEAMVVVVH